MSASLMYNYSQNRKDNSINEKSAMRHSGGRRRSVSRLLHSPSGDRTERRSNYSPKSSVLISALSQATDGKLHLCLSEADLPRLGTLVVRPIQLHQDESLANLRHSTRAYALREHIPIEARQDLETAVGEAATNAVVHGGGGVGSVYAVKGRKIQVLIRDNGNGIIEENLPQATLIRGFSTRDTLGHGLKMILQAMDNVYLLTGPSGTTIIMEQNLQRSVDHSSDKK